jgi:hypothetical protein
MIETLSSGKTNRHDERHEECHGGRILRDGAGGGPTRHFAVDSESIWTAKSCEREERQLELQGVHLGVTRQPGVENGLL